MTKCPYCNSTIGFKSELTEVENYNFKLTAISCRSCYSVITFMEYLNIGATLTQIKQKLDIKG